MGDSYWLYVVWNPLANPDSEPLKICNPVKHLDDAKREVVRYFDIPADAIGRAARETCVHIGLIAVATTFALRRAAVMPRARSCFGFSRQLKAFTMTRLRFPDRSLIEDYLPISDISVAASCEPRTKGHISTLHLWRARRPLVACRAAV